MKRQIGTYGKVNIEMVDRRHTLKLGISKVITP